MIATAARIPENNVHEVQFGRMRIRADLPPGWRVSNYVPNHHFIELSDDKGNTYRFNAVDLVRGECGDCGQSFYAATRLGAMMCPHCITGQVKWIWGDAKVSFVPEDGATFTSIPPPSSAFSSGDLPKGEDE